jgi:hypothetical protein
MTDDKTEWGIGADQDDPSQVIHGRISLFSPNNPRLLDLLVKIMPIQLPDYVV